MLNFLGNENGRYGTIKIASSPTKHKYPGQCLVNIVYRHHPKILHIFLSNLPLDYYIANSNDLTSITLNIDGKKKFQKGPKVKKEIRFCLLILTDLSSYLADARQQLSFLQISNIIVHRIASHSSLGRLGIISIDKLQQIDYLQKYIEKYIIFTNFVRLNRNMINRIESNVSLGISERP